MKASIIKKLREQRLKLTPQRIAIIDALVEKTSLHPGASLIYKEAGKKVKTLSLSTVYATLNELTRQGIIKTATKETLPRTSIWSVRDAARLWTIRRPSS